MKKIVILFALLSSAVYTVEAAEVHEIYRTSGGAVFELVIGSDIGDCVRVNFAGIRKINTSEYTAQRAALLALRAMILHLCGLNSGHIVNPSPRHMGEFYIIPLEGTLVNGRSVDVSKFLKGR